MKTSQFKNTARLLFLLGSLSGSVANAGPVNINTASAEVLAENIVGVGPVLADQIIAYRLAIGGFSHVDELLEVSGIGEKTIQNNIENIMIDGKLPQN